MKHIKAGLSLVFTEVAGSIQIIQISAVGRRSDDEVYELAKNRLNFKS